MYVPLQWSATTVQNARVSKYKSIAPAGSIPPDLLVSFGLRTMRPERIPLFPLNVVLFPVEQLPLHIFEPRYGRMDILTVGREAFRILEVFTDDPLLQGQIDYLEDHDSLPDPPRQKRLIE